MSGIGPNCTCPTIYGAGSNPDCPVHAVTGYSDTHIHYGFTVGDTVAFTRGYQAYGQQMIVEEIDDYWLKGTAVVTGQATSMPIKCCDLVKKAEPSWKLAQDGLVPQRLLNLVLAARDRALAAGAGD